ncbi:hypothetical protein [Microbacterium sp.]|uniref:hypothetical protein n=1 Tax=Microbacterium sp. TaxID=51671 RepID=UPI003A86F757
MAASSRSASGETASMPSDAACALPTSSTAATLSIDVPGTVATRSAGSLSSLESRALPSVRIAAATRPR